MPKPQHDVPLSTDGRRRITVDLSGSAAVDLQYVIDLLNSHGKPVSMSQVIRAALAFFREQGDYGLARRM
jgi:hypothetical protein